MFLTTQGGFLGLFASVFGEILNYIYTMLANDSGIANLGICIILFTIIVKILLLPVTFHQQKSAKINAYIQPEIAKIQKKYRDKKDQESMMKMNQETQAIYKKYGTSMAGGCLPALIQIPIFLTLYRVIQNIPAYVDKVYDMYRPMAEKIAGMENPEEILTGFVDAEKISNATRAVKDLEGVNISTAHIVDVIDKFAVSHFDKFKELAEISANEELVHVINASIPNIEKINTFMFGINISESPGYQLTPALMIPILSALFQFLSTKTMKMPDTGNQGGTMGSVMKSMNITMPLMSFFICVSFPAGLGLYWAISALLTLVIQLCINFYYDHTDMEKIIEKNMEKAKKKAEKNGGKKSFMERIMDQSEAQKEELEKKAAIQKMASSNLKSYVKPEDIQQNQNKYKKGSLGDKANIMLNYNSDKEDK